MKTYSIDYIIHFTSKPQESHTIKVKNSMSDLHAKVKLEDYLKRKHKDFEKLVVVSCTEDIFSIFGDIFNKVKPK